jgi:biofilm PGA synthesis N-glycosyltransferase PgaC
VNEGKAMALNDGLRCTNGEILLVMDADAIPDPKILRHVVPHFKYPRVGAVTGNPRVYNRDTLLSKLQAIEFTSIISLQRRAQRVWGRILTMSGSGAFHRTPTRCWLYSPEYDRGHRSSWKLQLASGIPAEPRAVWMRALNLPGRLGAPLTGWRRCFAARREA